MNLQYGNETINAKIVKTYPRKFKLGDFILGPDGNALKVVTVQNDVPIWESNSKTKTIVIFKTAAGMVVPVNGMSGLFEVLRPR